jgi:hypothetical protein
MMDADVSVACGGVLVNTGDDVFGDAVVIPADAAYEASTTALAKVNAENTMRDKLTARSSAPCSENTASFRPYTSLRVRGRGLNALSPSSSLLDSELAFETPRQRREDRA